MKTLWATLRHNQFLVTSLGTATMILVLVFGCEPRTKSLIQPGEKVTRAELNIELNTLLATAKIRTTDLERQEQIRNIIFQSAFTIAEGGKLSLPGLALVIGNVLGFGAIIDNRRKDAVIKTYKKIENGSTR